MRDPHVVALRYRVEAEKGVSYHNPPPLERDTEAFRMRLAEGIVTFDMKEHYTSEEAARRQVEPYLRAWEVEVALRSGRREISFIFERAILQDRDRSEAGSHRVEHAEIVKSATYVVDATKVSITRSQYPDPPEGFVVSPDVETMWNRYEGYRAGRENLQSMAYFCLTLLQRRAGGRKEAAERYGISRNVLVKLGELTEVGDEMTVRKVTDQQVFRSLTGAEVAWIEAVIKALIRREGEWVFDPDAPRPKLTMEDFPKLERE
jgi:hypothetical protein